MTKRSLQGLIRAKPGPHAMDAHLKELNDAPDRVVGIVQAADIEDRLEDLLENRMSAHLSNADRALIFEGEGTLSRFSDKIRIAFSFGLIGPETKRDITKIKDIRNAFAHARTHVSFTTPEISALCSSLELPNSPRFSELHMPFGIEESERDKLKAYYDSYSPAKSPRELYRFTTAHLSARLWAALVEEMLNKTFRPPSRNLP